MQFWLGTHQTAWLSHASVPLFISARRLRPRRSVPQAAAPWALDSGGFSEISMFGQWLTPAMQYSSEVRGWRDRIGGMAWAAIQDWMCEPFIVEKTGLTVAEHQRRTVHSWRLLRQLAPDLPWCPVIQGWEIDDYLRCVDMYAADGTDLATLPIVGLGSVCRRQDTGMAEELITELHRRGIKVHGFGFKVRGLRRVHHLLESADSLAWSFQARRSEGYPGCTHKSCANCILYAMRWRERLLRVLETPAQTQFDWDGPAIRIADRHQTGPPAASESWRPRCQDLPIPPPERTR
jgi:hypothetical protein